MSMSIAEQLQYSTVQIESFNSKDELSTGTGYFFKFKENPSNKGYVPVIITNKHVIEGAVSGKLTFTTVDATGKPDDTNHVVIDTRNFLVNGDTFESLFRKHPDPNVDLCAVHLVPFLDVASSQGHEIFFIPLQKSIYTI